MSHCQKKHLILGMIRLMIRIHELLGNFYYCSSYHLCISSVYGISID